MVIVVMHLRQVIYRKDVTKDRDLFLCSCAQSCFLNRFCLTVIIMKNSDILMFTKETYSLKVTCSQCIGA